MLDKLVPDLQHLVDLGDRVIDLGPGGTHCLLIAPHRLGNAQKRTDR